MDEDPIVRLSVAELRRAAAQGMAYYSCERFEDRHGRLVVGVGARLEDRTLKYVAQSGRKTVYASSTALCDSIPFRSLLRQAVQRGLEGETGPDDLYSEVWDRACEADRKAVGEAVQAVYRVCPEAVKAIERLRPYPRDLMHGVQVGAYARKLAGAFNRARDRGLVSALYPYSVRVLNDIFLAGVLHDIGRWNGRPVEDHTVQGARMLRELAAHAGRLGGLAETVAQHHRRLPELSGGVWDIHKTAPVVLAEAVVESSGSPGEAVCRLVLEGATEETKAVLITLCNLEGVVPPRAVVRIEKDDGVELAVSLRSPADDPSRPCLLRFARRNGRGPVPLFRSGEGEKRAIEYLTAPGCPGYSGEAQEVVDLLSERTYEQTFGQYERLVSPFRAALERRFKNRKRCERFPADFPT